MEIKKKILLIVGGGISAYKSLDLVRLLKKNNYEIKTVLTKSGKEFVTPLSLISLTGGKVYEDIFDKTNEAEIDHISLSRWADLILVIPTTANFISKLVNTKKLDSVIAIAEAAQHPKKALRIKKKYIFPFNEKNPINIGHKQNRKYYDKAYFRANIVATKIKTFEKYKSLTGKKILPI